MMENPFSAPGDSRQDRVSPKEQVDAILREAVITPDSRSPEGVRYLLHYGSKILELIYHSDTQEFVAIIWSDGAARKMPDETTRIYSAARKLMSTLTNKRRMMTTYSLITENERLVHWADTKGRKVFDWDDVVEHAPTEKGGHVMYEFKAHFNPREKNHR